MVTPESTAVWGRSRCEKGFKFLLVGFLAYLTKVKNEQTLWLMLLPAPEWPGPSNGLQVKIMIEHKLNALLYSLLLDG